MLYGRKLLDEMDSDHLGSRKQASKKPNSIDK